MGNCPCEECLVFPMCRNRRRVVCKNLISYLRDDPENAFSLDIEEAIRTTEVLYKKKIRCVFAKPFYETGFEDNCE